MNNSRKPESAKWFQERYKASAGYLDKLGQNLSTSFITTWTDSIGGFISIEEITDNLKFIPEQSKILQAKKERHDRSARMNPELYFRYAARISESLGKKEGQKLQAEADALIESYNKSLKNGQIELSKKFYEEACLRMKEIACIAGGFDRAVEYDKLHKWKDKIRGGKVAFSEPCHFMRPIPDDVVKKWEKAKPFFDGFCVMHCYDPKEQDDKGKPLNRAEKEKNARDPILFGCHFGSGRMFFIADWIDETCDLTFSELVRTLAGVEAEDTYGKVSIS